MSPRTFSLRSLWNDELGKPTAVQVAGWPRSSSREAAEQQDAQAAWTAPTGWKSVGMNVYLPSLQRPVEHLHEEWRQDVNTALQQTRWDWVAGALLVR